MRLWCARWHLIKSEIDNALLTVIVILLPDYTITTEQSSFWGFSLVNKFMASFVHHCKAPLKHNRKYPHWAGPLCGEKINFIVMLVLRIQAHK